MIDRLQNEARERLAMGPSQQKLSTLFQFDLKSD
jgi:hypothetical protein